MKHMMADKLDLTFLKELEREKVLDVLYRDKVLRTVEEERIRKLRSELQEIRRKGAKSFTRQYSGRTCARCQRPLGKLLNSGAVLQRVQPSHLYQVPYCPVSKDVEMHSVLRAWSGKSQIWRLVLGGKI
uniref:RabBD domain-containing protein n=1 Tax=Erpetoichthys calabaricus TaxID=27687 RepID=A0A8C4XAZ5_ERPCA